MTEKPNGIHQLHEKLEKLLKKQEIFSSDINELRNEINKLKAIETNQNVIQKERVQTSAAEITGVQPENIKTTYPKQQNAFTPKPARSKISLLPKINKNLEKFIGENLISKLGIIITVLGVAIGTKYSIDHHLISPLTRIMLGYIAGLILLGFGIKLKDKYENYSAVLVSGAMAVMYFITYFAYNFYDLMPQFIAFGLMVLFTVATVSAALKYNKQIIAHIGLVGAYAVPFLLSNESENIAILFTCIVIINAGILILAFKKYWKLLYYASFLLTWLIYFAWYTESYQIDLHFGLGLTYLSIFFVIFYITFLAYKLIQKEKFEIGGILLLLTNSFIFFGIGYSLFYHHSTGQDFLGLFSFCNAIIHFIAGFIIYRQKLADRNLFYLFTGLALIFITIAIPVQLDGNWVTLLWAGEAALLFWIGRTKKISFYEVLSLLFMMIAFISIAQDWNLNYLMDKPLKPILNITFLSSILFIAAFSFINIINNNKNYSSPLLNKQELLNLMSYILPGILVFTIYYTFRMEISNYWNLLFSCSAIAETSSDKLGPAIVSNDNLLKYKAIWLINYTMLFLPVLAFVNYKRIKSHAFAYILLAIITLVLLIFLMSKLFLLNELRDSYLEQSLSQYYQRGIFNIVIRYISLVFVVVMLYASYQYIYRVFLNKVFRMVTELVFHLFIIWLASSELINWMDIAGSTQSNKLGLSILWGVYSLQLIVLGIWKKKKYLRLGAIVLFGVTLIKLFLYDISHLNTISKTIVFVSLGLLLLIISFLYNKYKSIISDEVEKMK